jgi:hypothetical protein
MNDTSSSVKNKAHVFDWDRVISKYEKLEDLPGDLPVSDSESERIVSVYNRAIVESLPGSGWYAHLGLGKDSRSLHAS